MFSNLWQPLWKRVACFGYKAYVLLRLHMSAQIEIIHAFALKKIAFFFKIFF